MTRYKRTLLKLLPVGLLILLFAFIPESDTLTRPMLTATGLLLGSLWLWLSEALPMSVSILLMIVIAILSRLLSISEAYWRLDIGTALFVLSSSAITAAIALSSIPQRVTRWILHLSHGRSNIFIIGFGLVVTLCSSIMSSLATCAMFAGLVNSMLGTRKSNLKRCLMIIIPACAGIGGFITPAGTPANLLLLSILESHHTPLTFAQWSMIGLPIGILTSLLFLCSILFWFRPSIDDLQQVIANRVPLSPQRDKLTFVVILFILTSWFISSWIPHLQLWHVSCVGMLLMLSPGIRLLKPHDLAQHINWDLVITMGTVGILMGAISDSGLTLKFSNLLLTPFSRLSTPFLLPCLSLFICFIRTLIPTTTGVVTLLAPILINFAAFTGQEISVLLMLLGFWTASAMLIVWTEPIYLLTWANRNYSAKDLFKAGIIPSILMSSLGVWLIRTLTIIIIAV